MKTWFEAEEFLIDVFEGGNIEIPLTIGDEECVIEGEIGLILNEMFTDAVPQGAGYATIAPTAPSFRELDDWWRG